MKRFLWLAAMAALSARADDVIWTSFDVRITVETDGALSVIEKATAFVPPDAKEITRWYRTSADQNTETIRVVEIQPDGTETPQNLLSRGAFLRWKPRAANSPQRTYRIESRITGAVMPIWAIANWHDFAPNRYVLDYEYFFPDQQQGFSFEPSVTFGPEWKAVHAMAAGRDSSGYRVHQVFDYKGAGRPAAVDFVTPLFRAISLAGFPILSLVIWFVYLWPFLARPNISAVDARWLDEHLFNEDAEVIAARWSGASRTIGIESFLRRLERLGKVALDIGDIVAVRLKVPRGQLSAFEQMVIGELIPPGKNEIDSQDLQRMHMEKDFDPLEKAQHWLDALARRNWTYQKTPAASRAVSFAFYLTGFVLVVYDSVSRNPDPVVMLAPWALAALTAAWPSRFISRSVRRHRWAALLLLLPIVIFGALILALQTMYAEPLGATGSIGILLAAIGAYHAIVADATKSGGSGAGRIIDLAMAEAWFREQLRLKRPVRKEWQPYLAAFGLTDEPEREDEDWGWALLSGARSSVDPNSYSG